MGVFLQAVMGVLFTLGVFWFVVWLWDSGGAGLVSGFRSRGDDRCSCGGYRFVDGKRSHDDRSSRHARELCQPLRETIDN